MRWFKKVLKEVRKIMANAGHRTADVIDALRLFMESRDSRSNEVAQNRDLRIRESNRLMGLGIGLGTGLLVVAILDRIG